MIDKPTFIKRAEHQAKADLDNCLRRIQDVLGRVESDDDIIMEIHFEVLNSMMAEKGYTPEEIMYIQEL